MTSNESIYREICAIWDKDTIAGRAAYIKNKLERFIDEAGLKESANVSCNIIVHTVLDYFADIKRLKNFHNIKYTNKEKIVAYMAYWICRRKPIQLSGEVVPDTATFVNEAFVTAYIADELSASEEMVSDKLKKALFYHMKYRHLDPQSFEMAITAYLNGSILPST